MTAARQMLELGVAVECHDGDVVLQIGRGPAAQFAFLHPSQARRLAYQLAGAYMRAEREQETIR